MLIIVNMDDMVNLYIFKLEVDSRSIGFKFIVTSFMEEGKIYVGSMLFAFANEDINIEEVNNFIFIFDQYISINYPLNL